MYLDFQEVKRVANFEEVIRLLGLNLKRNTNHWRGACPACKANDRSLILTEGRGYFCFSQNQGGDIIALVAHIRGISMREAAVQLAEHYGILTVPPKAKAEERAEPTADPSLTPLEAIAARLDHAHPAVLAIMDTDTARRCGIGYDSRGLLRNRVAIPIFKHGQLIGFLGYSPEDHSFKVPDSLKAVQEKAA